VTKEFGYTWEQAVEMLRNDPQHQKLIYDSYLTSDLADNCHRFYTSTEFVEVLRLISELSPGAAKVLDMPAGNGIAAYAFAKSGFEVVAIEPDPSPSVGSSAIAYIQEKEGLAKLHIISAYGENLPCEDEEFDVVYIRQGLHHARDLRQMVSEAVRVTKRGGLIIAAREPVVDDYQQGLQTFLDAQPDHQLYGGENAFTHRDYLSAFQLKQVRLLHDLGPYDSIINLAPGSFESLKSMLLNSRTGRILKRVLPSALVYRLGISVLKIHYKEQGRLYTFVARRNENGTLRRAAL
jgi:ubiquinone/menaquinone biosynthesis C-methylase UbiE